MSKVEVVNIPESKGKEEITKKIHELAEERNEVVAKYFKIDPKNVIVELYQSTGSIISKVDPNGEKLGVFAGYVDGADSIMLIHPDAVQGLLDDVWKEMVILLDYSLIKFYLCKKFYPNREDFNLYYKYLSEALAQFASGRMREEKVKFEIKISIPGKKYKKDEEANMVMYLMKKNSGLEFIFDNLEKFIENKNSAKTFEQIYNKSLDAFLKPEKEKIIQEERIIREAELKKRQDKFRQMQQVRDQQQNQPAKKIYSKASFNPNQKHNNQQNRDNKNSENNQNNRRPFLRNNNFKKNNSDNKSS